MKTPKRRPTDLSILNLDLMVDPSVLRTAVIAVIEIPFDPVLHLGPLPVHWYGVAYVLAFIVGMKLATPFLRSRGISGQTAGSIFWWNIGIGLIGARLYYVVQQPDLSIFLHDPIRIFAVWQGGMAFFGAVMACLATTAVIAYRRRLPVWVLLDAAALFATLPQAIGRLGNIVNGDILGAPSTLPWAVRYTNPHTFAPSTTTSYQPANVYELIASLLLFGMVLLILSRRPRAGTAGVAYVAGYAVSQVLVFFTRATEPVLLYGLKQAQLTALGVLLIGVPLLLLAWRLYPDACADGVPRPIAHAVEAPASPGA